MIRVLLADDATLVRAGFRAILESDDGIEVVGQAPDGNAAVALAKRLLPDVLILTTFETDDYVFEALRAGASGFLVKDTEP